MPNSPVQIVLNPDNFRQLRDVGRGGPYTDFFVNQDAEFRSHKSELKTQLRHVKATMRSGPARDAGYAKVTLRKEAWAKSHRPLRSIFTPDRAPLVGGLGIGQMVFEVSSAAIDQVISQIDQAEDLTTLRRRRIDGREIPTPSVRRSEVGAIERIDSFGVADRRDFSVEQAVTWLSNPMTGGAYLVSLFDTPPPQGAWDVLRPTQRSLFESFVRGLGELGPGLYAERMRLPQHAAPVLIVRLERSSLPSLVNFDLTLRSRTHDERQDFNPQIDSHVTLLNFLDSHPLVRKIELPPLLQRSEQRPENERRIETTVPTRVVTASYPRVGVIDGGIDGNLNGWIEGRHGLLALQDRDVGHGTGIAALLVMGQQLNTSDVCPENDGCDLIDIDVFPQNNVFDDYYQGAAEFFDEVESAVLASRARYNVRVFNLSINATTLVSLDTYSKIAAKLDEVSEKADALIVISAGNVHPLRPEWSADPAATLAHLAATRNDGIFVPAESARNVSVSAINPPQASHVIPHAPASYSRRGPGLKAGVKPDLCHVGGAGARHQHDGHGLFTLSSTGSRVSVCGTSFAAPLVAKTLAALDHAIEGHASRETLIALLIHGARLPEPLQHASYSIIARDFAGFGMPMKSSAILDGDPHQITLVFASRLTSNQQLVFNFPWPSSLTGSDGKCRGRARITLVSSPPLDYRYEAELARVNIEAALQQEQLDGRFKGVLEWDYVREVPQSRVEAALIAHGLKWSPIKTYSKTMPKGIGRSSNWRIVINYLTRAEEALPDVGVPFTAILTIEDIEEHAPVFNEVRQALQTIGVRVADIRTAARIVQRV